MLRTLVLAESCLCVRSPTFRDLGRVRRALRAHHPGAEGPVDVRTWVHGVEEAHDLQGSTPRPCKTFWPGTAPRHLRLCLGVAEVGPVVYGVQASGCTHAPRIRDPADHAPFPSQKWGAPRPPTISAGLHARPGQRVVHTSPIGLRKAASLPSLGTPIATMPDAAPRARPVKVPSCRPATGAMAGA